MLEKKIQLHIFHPLSYQGYIGKMEKSINIFCIQTDYDLDLWPTDPKAEWVFGFVQDTNLWSLKDVEQMVHKILNGNQLSNQNSQNKKTSLLWKRAWWKIKT